MIGRCNKNHRHIITHAEETAMHDHDLVKSVLKWETSFYFKHNESGILQ